MRKKKEKLYTVEVIKRGRRRFGEIRTFPDGRTVYLAYRSMKDMFRNGHKTYSDALRANEAYWAFDLDVLLKIRQRSIPFIGVLVKENDDMYLARITTVLDPKQTRLVSRGHVAMRHVPLNLFVKKPGPIRV